MRLLHANTVTLELGDRPIVSAASLTLDEGRVIGLIGPNGAGKSTLLRLLAGLHRPDTGTVTLLGHPIHRLAPARRARQIAFIPQESAPPPPMAVRQLVALGRLPHGAVTDDTVSHPAVTQALEATDLLTLAQRPANHLSGGERARMNLARALATDTPVILADEPIAALDPAHALAMMQLFQEQAARGKGVIVVMHDLALATRFCDDLVLMNHGSVIRHGPAATVLDDATIQAVYGVTVRRIDNAAIPWALIPLTRRPTG